MKRHKRAARSTALGYSKLEYYNCACGRDPVNPSYALPADEFDRCLRAAIGDRTGARMRRAIETSGLCGRCVRAKPRRA